MALEEGQSGKRLRIDNMTISNVTKPSFLSERI